jgi:multidrug resistance efflux pump
VWKAQLNAAVVRKKCYWLATLLGCALPALLLTVTGCGGHGAAQEKGGESTPSETTVGTVTPKRQQLRRLIVQPGYLKAYETTPIYTKISGFVEEVKDNIDIGATFKKNEVLAQLWAPELATQVKVKKARIIQGEADVKQAKETKVATAANVNTREAQIKEAEAGVKRAEATFNRWELEFQRDKALYDKGIFDKATLEEATHQLEVARAAVVESRAKKSSADAAYEESKAKFKKAEADVEVAQALVEVEKAEFQEASDWYGYTTVTMPFDGIVTQRNIHTGHFVMPANSGGKATEPMFVVMRMDIMRVIVQVPEFDAPLVRDGAKAIVRLQALKDKEIEGKVTRSSWSFDDQARTLRVEVHLPNPVDPKTNQRELRPGMYANISIIADVPDAMTLPNQAVLTDGDKNYIYVIQSGKAVRVNVRVGVSNEHVVELLQKEQKGDRPDQPRWVSFTGQEQVIITSLTTLRSGQAVVAKH